MSEEVRYTDDFVFELLKQLVKWQDETTWLSGDVVKEMLVQAASNVLSVTELANDMTLSRQVDPDGMEVYTILTVGGERTLLNQVAVSTLRVLLLSWDELRGPQLGDPLLIPIRLADGRVVSEVVSELLEGDDVHDG